MESQIEPAVGAVPAPGPLSIFQVLFSPGDVFRRLAAKPRWVAALLTLWAFSVAMASVMAVRLDWEQIYRKQFAKNDKVQEMMAKLPEEKREAQMEQMVSMSAKFGRIGSVIGAFVVTPIVYLVLTSLFWVLLKVAGGSDWGFATAFAATLHGFAPAIPGVVVAIVVLMASDPASVDPQNLVASNLGALVTKEAVGPFAHALLSSIELFSIWSAVLLAIGFGATARVSKGKAAAFVFGAWAVYVLLKASALTALARMGMGA